MNDLIVVKYIGDHYMYSNIKNVRRNFERDSGAIPLAILDENTREEILEYLKKYNSPTSHLIIHLQSHGCNEGICKELLGKPNVGNLETLITWDDLINVFNNVSNRCLKLTVNLGTVCSSDKILNTNNRKNFEFITTNQSVSDTVAPRKFNRAIFNDQPIDRLDNNIYNYYRRG